MSITGFLNYNEAQHDYNLPPIGYLAYLATGHFWEATMENWESEYLQMGIFVLMTALLYEVSSPESRSRREREEEQQEEDEEVAGAAERKHQHVPRALLHGGIIRWFYENSLSLALLALFVISFLLHAASGCIEFNREQAFLGKPAITLGQFFRSSEFWFQSLQNWQSEFLAVASIIILSIFLRQKGSAESKRIGAP